MQSRSSKSRSSAEKTSATSDPDVTSETNSGPTSATSKSSGISGRRSLQSSALLATVSYDDESAENAGFAPDPTSLGPSPLSRILLGFVVLFLIGVLVRLIQLRIKRVRARKDLSPSPVVVVDSGGGGDEYSFWWSVMTLLSLVSGALVALYTAYFKRQAKDQRKQSAQYWNIFLVFFLVMGTVGFLEWSGLGYFRKVVQEPESSEHLWPYLMVGLAGLAAAKMVSNMMRLTGNTNQSDLDNYGSVKFDSDVQSQEQDDDPLTIHQMDQPISSTQSSNWTWSGEQEPSKNYEDIVVEDPTEGTGGQ